MCCEQQVQMQLMHSQTLTDLWIPTLPTLSAGWNGYTLLSVSRPPPKKESESRHSVVFLSVVKCLFFCPVKVVERHLNLTSFLIPASLLGSRRCSNFSIVILYTFCWYKGTRFTPDFCSLPGNNLCNCPLVMYTLMMSRVAPSGYFHLYLFGSVWACTLVGWRFFAVCVRHISQTVAQALCQCVKFTVKTGLLLIVSPEAAAILSFSLN